VTIAALARSVPAAVVSATPAPLVSIALTGVFNAEAATRGLKALLARAGDAPDFSAVEAQLVETETQVRTIFDELLPPAAG